MIQVNRKNSQRGFTLVEVIVVAIIVAALAAVAVPLYLNYVNSSRANAAANAAGSIASFCGACQNAGGIPTYVAGGTQVTCANNGAAGGNASTIQVPADITVTVVLGPPGVVTAHHVGSPAGQDTKTFNF